MKLLTFIYNAGSTPGAQRFIAVSTGSETGRSFGGYDFQQGAFRNFLTKSVQDLKHIKFESIAVGSLDSGTIDTLKNDLTRKGYETYLGDDTLAYFKRADNLIVKQAKFTGQSYSNNFVTIQDRNGKSHRLVTSGYTVLVGSKRCETPKQFAAAIAALDL